MSKTPVDDSEQIKYVQDVVLVNKIPTLVLTYGGWIDEAYRISQKKTIILILSGNPGNIEYYHEFMETIYRRLDGKFPVWGVAHAGHVKLPENYSSPQLSGNEHAYSVDGQTEHKLAFIKEWVPEDVSLILIGHSIGCHIALELMKRLPEHRILKSILLFPTIERLAESPKGKWMWPILAYFRPLLVVLIFLLSLLPTAVKHKVLEWYFGSYESPVPACMHTATMSILDANCVNKILFMANSEMKVVAKLDPRIISSNLKRLIFYYGATDGWCPVQYYEDMRKRFPDGNIMLCDKNFKHAFILESSIQVGEMVSHWIAEETGMKVTNGCG